MVRPIIALAGVALLAAAVPASAALVYNSGPLTDGSDCSSPPNCSANGSPLIVKFSFGPDSRDFGSFPSIDGSEFGLSLGTGGNTFTYTPGAGDPLLRYWAVGTPDNYRIWWLTEGRGGPADLAVGVPAGESIDWTLPGGSGHISFYDSGDGNQVPEPGTLALLGLGLAGLRLSRRRLVA